MPIDSPKLTLPFRRNSIKLQFAFPIFGRETVFYHYFVEGLDQGWSGPREKPLFHINRIPAGKYKVHVKAVNGWGESSDQLTIHLDILPPW